MHADSASSLKEQLSELLEPSCAREKKKNLGVGSDFEFNLVLGEFLKCFSLSRLLFSIRLTRERVERVEREERTCRIS